MLIYTIEGGHLGHRHYKEDHCHIIIIIIIKIMMMMLMATTITSSYESLWKNFFKPFTCIGLLNSYSYVNFIKERPLLNSWGDKGDYPALCDIVQNRDEIKSRSSEKFFYQYCSNLYHPLTLKIESCPVHLAHVHMLECMDLNLESSQCSKQRKQNHVDGWNRLLSSQNLAIGLF